MLLNDEAASSDGATQGLKHGTGKDSHIVLSPQPSEDPNDPLNWPKWKKDVITVILCLGAMLNAGTNVSTAIRKSLQVLISSGAIPQRLLCRHSRPSSETNLSCCARVRL